MQRRKFRQHQKSAEQKSALKSDPLASEPAARRLRRRHLHLVDTIVQQVPLVFAGVPRRRKSGSWLVSSGDEIIASIQHQNRDFDAVSKVQWIYFSMHPAPQTSRHRTVGGTKSIFFASATIICVTNTMVSATAKIASAADMIFFAAEKIISVIRTSVFVRSTLSFVASTMVFVVEMIISVAQTMVEDNR
jgi:hypothetical protein